MPKLTDIPLALCRVLLFAQALGVQSWGVECDKTKAFKAYTACKRSYHMYRRHFGGLSDQMENVGIDYITATLESVQSLPLGTTFIYSFWQGISMATREHLGKLASACPTFRVLCFVESGEGCTAEMIEDWVHTELKFPPMTLKYMLPVLATGGSRFTAYILVKSD